MSKNESIEYYLELASNYLSGNASSAETRELEAWVQADAEHKAHFIAFKKTWLLTGIQEDTIPVNLEKQWEQVASKTIQKAKIVPLKKSNTQRRWLAIAASLLVLAVASFFLFQNTDVPTPLLVHAGDSRQEVDLSDGSKIQLNQASSLSYLLNPASGQREVQLEGDAFFDVAKDKEHPFVIRADALIIEVLGTSFYVDVRKNQSEIQVMVESGRVATRFGEQELVLQANDKVIFDKKTFQLQKSTNQDVNFNALKTKTLVFEKTPLETVIFALNRQYHADIRIENKALQSCPLTATYNNKSLASILKILEQTLGIQIKENGQQILISGSCS